MFYNLIYPLTDVFSPLNLLRYLTFRSIAAFLTALILSFLIGGGLIRWLRSKQAQGQPIRTDGPQTHLAKKGTPTMGGLLILITLTIATLLWADLTNRYVWSVLGVTLAFGAVGFWDDFLKVTKRNPKGVPGKIKLAISIVASAVATYFIAQGSPLPLRYMMAVPFFKDVLLPLGLVLVNAAYQLLASKMARTEDALTTVFYTCSTAMLLSSLPLAWVWQPVPDADLWLGLLLMGVAAACGNLFFIWAFERAPAATIMPYMYLQIGFGILAGWLVFDHVPDFWAMVGMAMIAACGVAGGLLTVHENRAQQTALPQPS